MNKELLNKILPYCGYGLKAIYEDDMVNVCISSSGTNRINTEHLLTKSSDGTYHYKPVLFPPDCLVREIETEYGKEIPLIEMAKIVLPGKLHKWEIKDCRAKYGVISVYLDIDWDIVVDRIISSDGYKTPERPQNQWEVFQYLYSRHIAFNLDPDDYVSIESLKNNPYAE